MKALLGALLALALPTLARAQTGAQTGGISPIQQEGDFYILNFSENPAEQLPLLDFVKLAQEATGFNFTYDPATGTQLAQAKVVMLGPKRFHKSEFYNFFQIQLFINDFVCQEVGPPQISLILIQNLGQGGAGARGAGGALGKSPVFVSPNDLDDYKNQPASLIITVLNFDNIDSRQLQTQLRQLLVDNSGYQQVVPAGERSLILQGFGSYIASLATLLNLVDDYSAQTQLSLPVFDLIPLEFAAAEDVADLLEQLLEAQQDQINRRPRPQAGAEGVSGLLPGNELESKILVDGRTNSLLVMAPPDEMPRIKDLVARLDVDVIEPERNFHVYSLQNVKSGEIADVLDEFLSGAERLAGPTAGGTGGRPQGGGDGGGSGGASARTSNEVIVVADEASNALLIAANKTRYEEVLELIRQLDRRQDQVLIESALIELTGTDFRDIGVEWALGDVVGVGGFGVTGFGFSDINLETGVRTPNEPSGGVVAGILSGDDVNLPLLLSAAAKTTGANVLNVPSVLVNNNGSATVTTKDEFPTTTTTFAGTTGTQQDSFQGFQEAGITLEISPSISASRYLRLDISLIVSNFVGAFQSGSNVPPPRVTREMKTTVNVPDGDTMVIGGVISDSEQSTREGVPWLMDIPLLGALFRHDSDTNQRTTLYFFVTPHILRDPDFADLSEISYQKKLNAAEIMGKRRVRMIDPDFGADEGAVDFGSFQVPLYRPVERGEVDPQELGLDPLRREELLREARENDKAPEPKEEPPTEPKNQ